jgi:hypothetical protein
MTTNDRTEKIRLSGLLEGLNRHLDFISKYITSPEYRGDMTDEITRIKSEIDKAETKFNSLN